MAPLYRSGIIECEDYNVVFYQEDFRFVFLAPKPYQPFGENQLYRLTPDEHGFITGRTHEGQPISIYINNEMEILTTAPIVSGCYILGTPSHEYDHFSSVKFSGGIINLLHYPDASVIEYDEETGKLICENNMKELQYSYSDIASLKDLYIESHVKLGKKLNGGSYYKSTDSTITWSANDDELDWSDLITVYNTVLSICQFLSFRKNVSFDQVKIQRKAVIGETSTTIDVGEVFMRFDRSMTEKKGFQCIPFESFDEDKMHQLLSVVTESRRNHPSFLLDYLPDGDDTIYKFDSQRIKDILTSMESTMMTTGVTQDLDDNYKALINSVKRLIEEHRNSEKPLDRNTYNFLFGSISHWSKPLKDRIIQCAEKHMTCLHDYLTYLNRFGAASISYNDEYIRALITYRNKHTHGTVVDLNTDVGKGALIVIALIYTLLLSYFGFSEKQISDLFQSGLLVE